MPILQLFGVATALFVIVSALLLPLGLIVSKAVLKNVMLRSGAEGDQLLLVPVAFALSTMIYSAVTTGLVLFTQSNRLPQIVILPLACAAGCLWLKRGGVDQIRAAAQDKGVVFYTAFFFLLYLLALLILSPPAGDLFDMKIEGSMGITGLPIDSLIPFNASRYFVERIDPRLYDVVPEWYFTDRGPLAAILNSTLFFALGLQERAAWLGTSPGLFFVYQAVLTYLNGFIIITLALLTRRFFGPKAALMAVLIFATGYFPFLNIMFAWPKFFMTSLLLVGVLLAHHFSRPFLGGAVCAAAVLAHDSALFGAVAFGIGLGWPVLRNRTFQSLITPTRFGLGFLLAYSPWIVAKRFLAPPSSRLLQLHLFCDNTPEAAKRSVLEGFNRYMESHSWSDFVFVRLQNLVHPFDFTAFTDRLSTIHFGWFSFSQQMVPVHFFFLFGAIGIVPFLLFLRTVCRRHDRNLLLPFSLAAFGALPIFGLLSGCEGNTVNHHWGYPAITVVAMGAGIAAARSGVVTAILLGLSASWSVFLLLMNCFYLSSWAPFRHTTPELAWTQWTVFILLAALSTVYVLKESWNDGAVHER